MVSGDRRVYRYSARRRIWGEMPSLNNFEDAALSARQAEPAEIINASIGGAARSRPSCRSRGLTRRPPLPPTFAALDLGTNNCRLLIARPSYSGAGLPGFRIVDSFSRIVRLGEGVSQTGPPRGIGDPAHARGARDLPRQNAGPARDPRAADRDRSLPDGGKRPGIHRPRARNARPRT